MYSKSWTHSRCSCWVEQRMVWVARPLKMVKQGLERAQVNTGGGRGRYRSSVCTQQNIFGYRKQVNSRKHSLIYMYMCSDTDQISETLLNCSVQKPKMEQEINTLHKSSSNSWAQCQNYYNPTWINCTA